MITSSSNPRVKQVVQWQASARERHSTGVFVTEGFKLFQEAPAECLKEVYISREILDREPVSSRIWEKLEQTGYETVSAEVFRKMSDTQTPQGILCVAGQPVYRLEQLLQAPCPLLTVLEDIQDPGNLGTIFRTGEGAGVTGIIMSRGPVDLFNPKTIRATMGSIFRVPFIYAEELREAIGSMRAAGIRVYAAHLAGEKYYDQFDYKTAAAFLIGNEGRGLRQETAEAADEYLKIPMEGRVESLNAGVAAALLTYEARRQRRQQA